MMRFTIVSRLELHRNPGLRGCTAPASEAVATFYEWMVDDAIRRGEIPADIDAAAVVNTLFAMFWGMGFFAGFVHKGNDVMGIAKQLHRLLVHGLLEACRRDGADSIVLSGDLPVSGCASSWTATRAVSTRSARRSHMWPGPTRYRETPDSSRALHA